MYWTSPDIEQFGRKPLAELVEFYELEVDHAEYPDFGCWVWDMERSGVLCRHEG